MATAVSSTVSGTVVTPIPRRVVRSATAGSRRRTVTQACERRVTERGTVTSTPAGACGTSPCQNAAPGPLTTARRPAHSQAARTRALPVRGCPSASGTPGRTSTHLPEATRRCTVRIDIPHATACALVSTPSWALSRSSIRIRRC